MASKHPRKGGKRPSTKGSENGAPRGFYILLGIVAVAGVVFVLTQMTSEGRAVAEPVQMTLSPSELEAVEGVAIGSEDAPVLIEEFSDFQCPACASYNALHAGVIKDELVETGQARYVFYNFPLVGVFQNAFLAARASRCAEEQDAFWTYGEVLYARQPEWGRAPDADARFIRFAEALGLDRRSFASCLRSDRYAEEVTETLQLGVHRGVQATPTVFVNGEAVGDFSASNIIRRAEEIVRSRSPEREDG